MTGSEHYKIMRSAMIALNRLENVDDEYEFYYDETNNIRKLSLRHGTTNETTYSNFVLGGVMHRKHAPLPNLNSLKEDIQLPSSSKEIKFKHIASGDFETCLGSEKLRRFLSWLESSELYIHYSNIDMFYWSIVDIIDSTEYPAGFEPYLRTIKTIFSDIINTNRELFIYNLDLFDYPNIKNERSDEFLEFLLNFVEANKSQSWHPVFTPALTSLLRNTIGKGSLDLITGLKDKVLIDNFAPFYISPMILFENSNLTFDCEEKIQAVLLSDSYVCKQIKNERVVFKKSHECELIQVSDVVVGILGKYFSFLNGVNLSEITSIRKGFNEKQLENLKTLNRLLEKTDELSEALSHAVVSDTSQEKHIRMTDFN
ncbi:DUF3800 domain-containing protein [Pseudomonas yamanorum]|nr:DUF3800 domain-containing protein [Pseudomonas yamanorum]